MHPADLRVYALPCVERAEILPTKTPHEVPCLAVYGVLLLAAAESSDRFRRLDTEVALPLGDPVIDAGAGADVRPRGEELLFIT